MHLPHCCCYHYCYIAEGEGNGNTCEQSRTGEWGAYSLVWSHVVQWGVLDWD